MTLIQVIDFRLSLVIHLWISKIETMYQISKDLVKIMAGIFLQTDFQINRCLIHFTLFYLW